MQTFNETDGNINDPSESPLLFPSTIAAIVVSTATICCCMVALYFGWSKSKSKKTTMNLVAPQKDSQAKLNSHHNAKHMKKLCHKAR